ncbi:MAG: VOC family protein [Chloroflexi bacterium]|nr:VOC family protein [Chloroflexota bacterium]
MIRLNPYVHFKGNAREAMEFYQSVFGGTLNISTFSEYGMADNPTEGNKIMHSQLEAANGLVFMGSDTPSHMAYQPGATITMSLSGTDEAQLRGYWDKLAVGATIDQPLQASPWGDHFGMLTDQYGIEWMVNITAPRT